MRTRAQFDLPKALPAVPSATLAPYFYSRVAALRKFLIDAVQLEFAATSRKQSAVVLSNRHYLDVFSNSRRFSVVPTNPASNGLPHVRPRLERIASDVIFSCLEVSASLFSTCTPWLFHRCGFEASLLESPGPDSAAFPAPARWVNDRSEAARTWLCPRP
jgi:hypothetical protein